MRKSLCSWLMIGGISLAVLVLAGQQAESIDYWESPQPRHMVVVVAASTSPVKVKNSADYVCKGTDDQVPMQAAIDEVAARSHKGIVKFSAGQYSCNAASGQANISGTGTLTSGVANSSLTVGTDVDSLSVGQLLLLTGGDREGNTLEDDFCDGIYTMKVVNVGAQTVEVNAPIYTGWTWTGVSYKLLRHSLLLPPRVALVGEGPRSTSLLLASGANCGLIHLEDTTGANGTFPAIRNMELNGNAGAQTCDIRESNGIVANDYTFDLWINSVFSHSFKGVGIYDGHCWGTVIDGQTVCEWNKFAGIVMRGEYGRIIGVKSITNDGPGLLLNSCNQTEVNGGLYCADAGWGIMVRGGLGNRLNSIDFARKSATSPDGQLLFCQYGRLEADSHICTGSLFYIYTGKTAIKFTDRACYCNVDGFQVKWATPGNGTIVSDLSRTNSWRQISGSRDRPGPVLGTNKRIIIAKNVSGGQLPYGRVVVESPSAAGDEFTTTTVQGDDNVLGMLLETVDNDAYGPVLVEGKTTRLKVNGTANIAIGDLIGTYTEAGVSMKAEAGDMAYARALEAYTTDDSNGVIDARIIMPRKL